MSRRGVGSALIAAVLAASLAPLAPAARADVANQPPGLPDLREPLPTPGPDAAPALEPGLGVVPDELGRRYIDAAEFRRAFENRTVHLSSGSLHYGSEYYLPGDRAIWVVDGGPCRRGEWTYQTPLFCFTYGEDGPHCWRVFESDGVYYAESIDGLLLEIYAVEEQPLSCDPELFS